MSDTALSGLFLNLLNRSIAASWMVPAVLVLRLVLKRAPKWVRPALWGLVGLRLALPFSVKSMLSLIPSAETVPQNIVYAAEPAIDSGIPALNQAVNPVIAAAFAPAPVASANPLQIWTFLASLVWLAGLAALVLYAAVSYGRLRWSVRTAVLLRDNIFQCETVASPFVLGVLRPRIYLPFRLADADMGHVVAHEQAHIARRDHWWKPLGFGLLAVFWFNPLLWLSYVLLCRDIELACDERVVRDLDAASRADYSQALLTCSAPRSAVSACPLAFGETGVKARVRDVLRYRKPALWITALAVLACTAAAVCFLTDPTEKAVPAGEPSAEAPAHAPPASGQAPEESPDSWSFSGTVFTCKGKQYDLSERNAAINAIQDCVRAGDRVVLTCHGGPKNYLYCIFDPETETFEPDIVGVGLIWQGDDISTALYALGDTIRTRNGAVVGYVPLNWQEDAFIRSLAFTDDPDTVLVTVEQNAEQQAVPISLTRSMPVSYTLPAGLTATEYSKDIGPAGGILLKPDAYETDLEPEFWSCPPEWRAAGMIARYYTENLVEWAGDRIARVDPLYNHTGTALLGPVDGLCAPAYLMECNHDLYTAAELGAMEESGIDLNTVEATSDYWYLWFARPGEELGYVLSLNAKNYGKEDILAFAASFSYEIPG